MMKKILLMLFLAADCFAGNAQYFNVTHMGGTAPIGGINVTVTSSGTFGSFTCGTAGPYWEGGLVGAGSYTWTFSSPIAGFRVHMDAIQLGDDVSITVNGVPYFITSSNLTNWASGCNTNFAYAAGGLIIDPVGIGSTQIDVDPCYDINAVTISSLSGLFGVSNDFQFIELTGVIPVPGIISGPATLCTGNSYFFTTTGTAGGTWSSSDNSIANINSTTGAVTPAGPNSGPVTITYTVNTPCGPASATFSATVYPTPVANLIPPFTLCQGQTQATDAGGSTPGGTWTCGSTSVATVDGSGVVTGVAPGTAIITYTVSSPPCGTATATTTVTVLPLHTAIATYSGCTPVCPGTPIYITISGIPGDYVTFGYSDPLLDPHLISGGAYLPIPTGYTTLVYTPTVTGTFIFQLNEVENMGEDPHCANHVFQEIDIPVANPKADFVSMTPCMGTPFTLNLTGDPGDIMVDVSVGGTTYTVPMFSGSGSLSLPGITSPTTYCITRIVGACCTIPTLGPCITLTPLPYPMVTLACAPNPVCAGQSYTVTATSTSTSIWYDWSWPGHGLSTPSLTYTFPYATLADAGVYSFGAWNGPCPSFATITLTVTPMPSIPTVTYTGCTPPCPNTLLTWAVAGTAMSTVSFYWTDPSGGHGPTTVPLDVAGNGTLTITPSGSTPGLFYLGISSVTAATGCVNPLGVGLIPLDLEWPFAGFFDDPVPPCVGGCVTLALVGTPGATTYIDPGHVPVTFPPLGAPGEGHWTGCITVTETTTFVIGDVTGPCCSHYSGASKTVIPIPYPVLSLSANTPCAGHPLNLTGTCIGCSSTYDWTWPGGGTGLSIPTTSPVNSISAAMPWDAGVYTITGYSGNGRCAATMTTTVTVAPIPTATMACTTDACGITTLTFSGGPDGSVITYDSYPYGAVHGTATLVSGTATATVTPTGTTTINISTIIGPPPTYCTPAISFPGCIITPPTPPTACVTTDGSSFYITGTSTSCAVTYNLYNTMHVELVHAAIAHVGDVLTTFPSGTFVMCITSVTCGDCTINFDTNVDGYYPCCAWLSVPAERRAGGEHGDLNSGSIPGNQNALLSVIPNPNKGVFTIKGSLPNISSAEIKLEVIDMVGQIVYSDVATAENGNINKNITLGDNIANGVYFIKVRNDDVSQVIRFTLSR